MQNNHLASLIAEKMVLILCGIIVTGIAIAMLVAPEAPDLSYAIALGRDRQLTNALRMTAFALLIAGVVILSGALRMRWAGLAATTAAVVFIGLGVGQSLVLLIGGFDEEEIVVAAVAEFAIGAISLINLNNHRKRFRF